MDQPAVLNQQTQQAANPLLEDEGQWELKCLQVALWVWTVRDEDQAHAGEEGRAACSPSAATQALSSSRGCEGWARWHARSSSSSGGGGGQCQLPSTNPLPRSQYSATAHVHARHKTDTALLQLLRPLLLLLLLLLPDGRSSGPRCAASPEPLTHLPLLVLTPLISKSTPARDSPIRSP